MERFRRLGVANLIPRTRLSREEGDGQSSFNSSKRSEKRTALHIYLLGGNCISESVVWLEIPD